jgi:phage gp29-like protein
MPIPLPTPEFKPAEAVPFFEAIEWFRLQAPRDVRKPLHDALGFADDTVDAMAAATPDAMDDVTGQILKVLADSKDFTDAKKRMLEAFPTLDRSKLRDVLTGGMMIAQAMGRESVKREVSK